MSASVSDFVDSAAAENLRFANLTLKEAIDMIEADDSNQVDCIYIEPPEASQNSDEDSANEDEGGLVDNLSGKQLQSLVEIVLLNNNTDGPGKQNVKETATSKKRKKYTWKEGTIAETASMFPEANYARVRDFTPTQLFEYVLGDEILPHIILESNKYAGEKNAKNLKLTIDELKVFIAILFLSGYNTVPSKRSYWEAAMDLRNELVSNAMRRDRFLEICKYIHFADNNNIDKNDKMWKLRPIVKILQKRYTDIFQPEENLDFDECMVAYYGRHSCKQFIRGKPIRFGYKVWCLNSPSGYLLNFEIYQGKNPFGNSEFEKDFGKAAAPLVQMLEEMPENLRHFPYKLYFDNLFTGMQLLQYLKSNGYGGTGTFRENRIPKDCPLTCSKEMKKKVRGTFESKVCEEENILILKWVDNSVVSIASTCHGIEPITKVYRYCHIQKRKLQVPQPSVLANYNKYMGGTDRMDENIAYYRIGVRSKKWYWSLFTWMLDTIVHNAWILARKTGKNISQLEFRRQIVQTYLISYKNAPSGSGRPSTSKFSTVASRVSDDIRLDGKGHLVAPCNRRRCAAPTCNRTIRTECIKCSVGLCVECFVNFHKN